MTFRSSIVENMNTFFDETIHITLGCATHLHGHQNKVVPLMKPFIFTNISNGTKFHNTPASQFMTLITIVSYVESITILSTTKTWSSQIMQRLIHNETLDIKAYHHFLHTMCSFFQVKAYMTSLMVSCVIYPLTSEQTMC